MIVYNSKDWFKAISHFHKSWVIQMLLRRVIYIAILATVITVVNIELHPIRLQANGTFFSLLGILLSLLLVFRTNTAYDRFWEGRKLWGALVNHCRNFAVNLDALLPDDDRENRFFFAKMISNFPIALKDHLREGANLTNLEEAEECTLEDLKKYKHVPARLTALMVRRIERFHREKSITAEDVLNLKMHHKEFLDIAGACERIRKTPIPYSYSFFIKFFISVYVVFMPFVLVESLGYWTIIASTLGAYALIGIEMIADEIEEPFGTDCNDLPTETIATNIRLDVHEILGVAPSGSSVRNPEIEYSKIR